MAASTIVQVLFTDYNDVWSPLSDMYWSQQSSVLISRHPISSVEEILAPYCPQCLSRYSEEDAILAYGRCTVCKECPHCLCPLPPDANTCEFCQGRAYPAQSQLQNSVSKTQESVFKTLLDNLRAGDSFSDGSRTAEQQSSQKNVRAVWQMEELKRKLEQSLNDHESESDRNAIATQTALDDIERATAAAEFEGATKTQDILGVPLRSKRILRSKQDSRTGRMNILIQPKNLPLEGDSSLKLQKGKWWMKDSSAVQELPFVSVAKLPDRDALVNKTAPSFIELCITNPKMAEVRVVLSAQSAVGAERCGAPYLQLGRLGVSSLVRIVSTVTALPHSSSFPHADEGDEASLAVTIGGFEDELLKDVDDAGLAAPPPASTDAVGAARGDSELSPAPNAPEDPHFPRWTHNVIHNKAYVKIPVELSSFVPSGPFELNLSCTVNLGGELTKAVNLPFKINFVYNYM